MCTSIGPINQDLAPFAKAGQTLNDGHWIDENFGLGGIIRTPFNARYAEPVLNFFQAQEIVSEHTSLMAAQCKLQEEYTELLAEEFQGVVAAKKTTAGTPSPAKSTGSARSSASKPKVRDLAGSPKPKKSRKNPEPPKTRLML